MEEMILKIGEGNIILTLLIINVALLIGIISIAIKTSSLSKKYSRFMQKLGDGKSIEEDLENYMYRVERVEKQHGEIMNNINTISKDLEKCVKKIGIVRYNAFDDVGSDLSFTLAMLDEANDGIVLNGIYSRDTSNIFAKPVEKGKSKYTLSEEEKQAINKAIESKKI